MTDPKDYNSIDDLFRSTFEQLPATPEASGWDVPSERVWQHIQAELRPPRQGWNIRTVGLLGAFAVSIAVGLYFAFARPESPKPAEAQPNPAPVETPVAAPVVEPAATISPNRAVHTTTRPVGPRRIPAPAAQLEPLTHSTSQSATSGGARPGSSAPLHSSPPADVWRKPLSVLKAPFKPVERKNQ